MPDEIVYDQDKVFIVNKNGGYIILKDAFKAYTRERYFTLHFCKKADPESKGYVKFILMQRYPSDILISSRHLQNLHRKKWP